MFGSRKNNVGIMEHMSGRALLKTEIPYTEEVINKNINAGRIAKIKGLHNGRCNRCGNTDNNLLGDFFCYKCSDNCRYCRYCIKLGKVSSCQFLYVWTGESLFWSKTKAHIVPDLSEEQKKVSEGVVEAVLFKKKYLVWAVAGAGKTEMIFASIEAALQRGQRIAFSAPRVDVVIEISQRLKRTFPETLISTLYGSSDEVFCGDQLVVLTTHQLLRFKEAFDVIIIDEVDAYPYTLDDRLQQAVKEAVKYKGAEIYLTATPNKKMQDEFNKKKRLGMWVPARFHRYPLPVPRLAWIGNWESKINNGKLPLKLETWLRTRRGSFLLFFPNIKHMKNALPIVKKILNGVDSVHSDDEDRKEKVKKLREGELVGLLTTTILERGITISNVEVAVLGADRTVFTEEALVQISGRVGRNPYFPRGDIVFFHNGQTKEMRRAVKQIKCNNTESAARGLIDFASN